MERSLRSVETLPAEAAVALLDLAADEPVDLLEAKGLDPKEEDGAA